MSRQTKLATFAVCLGNSIFGFSFMFTSIALRTAQPFVMLMYRFVLAFLVLNAIALWSARSGRFASDAAGNIHWLRFQLKARQIAPLLLMGLFEPVVYFLCESYGIQLTNATVSGVIIALIPIAALAGGFFVLGEAPKQSQIFYSLLSVAGVILITLQQNASGQIHIGGVLLLIGAIISAAGFNILTRRLSTRYSVLERTYVMMMIGAVLFTSLAIFQCRHEPMQFIEPLKDSGFCIAILYLGLFSSIVAFMCLNYGNTCLPIAKTAAFCNLTTVISLFAGVIFLHESFHWVSLFASGFIILGIWGVQRAR